ncbi:hypothetical protein FRB97_006693 [Tulasnella sp. 331]|nr:hypothetical protein FRB97_006693 [Tulasnella sp. 331]
METVLESPVMMNESSIPLNVSEAMMLAGHAEAEGERAAHALSPHAADRPPSNSPAPPIPGRYGTLSPSQSAPLSQSTLGAGPGSGMEYEIDPAILEALRTPKERLFVLKLADAMENLINERGLGKPNARTSFQPASSYQRLLVHRCSAYYKLTPEAEQATKAIVVTVNPDSRVPPRRISELVPAESTSSQPTFKIMRRTTPDQRNKTRALTPNTSVSALSPSEAAQSEPPSSSSSSAPASSTTELALQALDGIDPDDPDAAILKELGLPPPKARSSGPGTTTPRKTIEEREAAYLEAKRRIFSDFPEREKEAARLREDREREREVRDLHRELAAEEEERGAVGVGASDSSGTTSQPYGGLGPSGSPDPQSGAADLSASAVYYPSLYDPSGSGEAGSSNAERSAPVQPGLDQPYPLPPSNTPFDQTHGHYTPAYPLSPYAGTPYPPYPTGVNGMHMAGPQQQVMGPYVQYPSQTPIQMGVIPMIPYPYYPPPQSWGDPQNGFMPAAPGMENAMGQNGYPMYAVAMQPPSLWTPAPPPHQRQHQPGRQPNDGPHQSNQPHPQQLHPNAPSFIPSHPSLPPAPYFNPNVPQQPYPQQQQMRPPLPPHAQNYTFSPQGSSSQRQLWNPNSSGGGGNNNNNNSGKKDAQGRNGGPGNGQQQRSGGNNRGMPPPFAPTASISPSSSPVKLGLTPSSRSHNRNGSRDYGKSSASIIATPMTQTSMGPGETRSRNSSVSSTSARSALVLGSRMWGSGVLGGMSPVSPGRAGSLSNLSSPDPCVGGDIGGMAARIGLGRGLGARRGSGSAAGSLGSGSNGGESGTRTPLDETASVSSSISSASSSRTFTSTSSKHPSLPARPDWSMGPMGLLHATSSRASISSQSSTRANPRSVSSNNSNPAHSRSHSSQSHAQTSTYPILQPTDFPPLPGAPSNGQGPPPHRPLMTLVPQDTAWGDGRLNMMTSAGPLQNGISGGTMPPPIYMNGRSRESGGGGSFQHGGGTNNLPQMVIDMPHAKQTGRASTPVGIPRSTSSELVNGTLSGEMARLDVTDGVTTAAES